METQIALEPRAQRGYGIIANGTPITQLDEDTFLVPSQTRNAKYLVRREGENWSCECPDHQFRLVQCKHIYATQLWLALKTKIQTKTVQVESPEIPECKFCKSPNVIRYGKKGRKQAYHCGNCNRTFVVDDLFRRLKFDPQVIASTLDLYFKGVSLRKISDHLQQQYGINVNYSTISLWMNRYVKIMGEYVSKVNPELSGIFHADEMKVRVAGEWRWLWSMMDRDSRFILASQISEKREVEDAQRLFAKAKGMMSAKPGQVITDGLQAYKRAFNKEFYTMKGPRTEHVSHIRLAGDMNNNIIERLNGTRRERDKVLRGMKTDETPIREGFDIYYNYIRPHQGLEGKTPAEAAKIDLKLDQNRLLSLLKKSLEHHTKSNTPSPTN